MPQQSLLASACQSLLVSLTQPPGGFALGLDAAVLSPLAGGTRTPDPYCTAASAAAKHTGGVAWGPANSIVLHAGECQAEAAR